MFYFAFKYFFDRFLSFFLLIALLPLLLIISSAILCFDGGPVLFVQRRAGLNGKAFRLFKFRTMSRESGPNGLLLADSLRITRLGSFLRLTSLDELPSLANVLFGSMSLVGPRPLLISYLPLYSQDQLRRHDVLPGVSGWAQVNGRNNLSWEDKFRLDLWYVDHCSFCLDLRVLFLTFWKVLSREGISASGEATMAPFRGSSRSHE